MGNKVINLVLQHILRAHCTAACYPRISVCILVLRHVFGIRDEGVQVGGGIEHVRHLYVVNTTLGATNVRL